jgi:hypothetical protein
MAHTKLCRQNIRYYHASTINATMNIIKEMPGRILSPLPPVGCAVWVLVDDAEEVVFDAVEEWCDEEAEDEDEDDSDLAVLLGVADPVDIVDALPLAAPAVLDVRSIGLGDVFEFAGA